MDKNKVVKYGLMAAGMLLTAGANLISNHQQKESMKEEIAKEVAKTLSAKQGSPE